MDVWGAAASKCAAHGFRNVLEKKSLQLCVCLQELRLLNNMFRQCERRETGPAFARSIFDPCEKYLCCYRRNICQGFNPSGVNQFVFDTSEIFSNSACSRCRAITADGSNIGIDDPALCSINTRSSPDSISACDTLITARCSPTPARSTPVQSAKVSWCKVQLCLCVCTF